MQLINTHFVTCIIYYSLIRILRKGGKRKGSCGCCTCPAEFEGVLGLVVCQICGSIFPEFRGCAHSALITQDKGDCINQGLPNFFKRKKPHSKYFRSYRSFSLYKSSHRKYINRHGYALMNIFFFFTKWPGLLVLVCWPLCKLRNR